MAASTTLPDSALVVRGGRVTDEQLLASCGLHEGVFGFSVQSAADQTVDQLVSAGRIPHARIAVTNVGKIRGAGLDVIPTRGKGFHATVSVPPTWTDREFEVLTPLFSTQKNPAPSPRS